MTTSRDGGLRPPVAADVPLPEFVRRVALRDGRVVEVRPVRSSDAAEIAQAMLEGDADTLRARFLGTAPRPSPALLAVLTRLDLVEHFALIAHAEDGEGVAIARYGTTAADDRRAAEVAVVVRPGWRRAGLGKALVEMLAERAEECGIASFTAIFWADNEAVGHWVRSLGAHVRIEDGAAEMRLDLAEVRARRAG